jgi:hypothetical protein
METRTLQDVAAGGIDQRYYPDPNQASNILNFRYDTNGGWRNDRGWEPLIPYSQLASTGSLAYYEDLFQPCRFLQVIQRHQGAEEYYVQERNGNLFYEFGNFGGGGFGNNKIIIDTDRNIPKPSDPGTQAIPYGRFTLFMNGYNDMIKWWGREKTNQFGFYQQPPSPTILPVFPEYNKGLSSPAGTFDNTEVKGICIQFETSDSLGLGDPAPGARSTYSYKITYVTDTGSESPLSDTASVTWRTLPNSEEPTDAQLATQKKYGVILTGLDPGHDGVVARRIYRTKNKKNGNDGAGDVYYFLTQIDENTTTSFVDTAPDNQLTVLAPSVSDSVRINTSYKFGAAWNGSMWIAGGEGQPTMVRYSKPGLPEQFGAFDFFDVGVRDGGHITALYPYYDVLLVFRERTIDAVFVNAQGNGYSCTTINKDTGTTATNTIKLMPATGVMFLNKDGFWLLSGGLRGGATFQVTNMSTKIESEMGRLSKNALARATAAYSEKEREYWCHYPVDGRTENSRGSVYNTTVNGWSFRGYDEDKLEPQYRWNFTNIAVDQTGYFILGTIPYTGFGALITSWTGYPGVGLQVWSGRRSWGDIFDITDLGQGIYSITSTPQPVGVCLWESTWYDFGDDSIKKRINTIELESISEGSRNSGITLYWSSDWDWEENSAGKVSPLVGEIAYTQVDQWSYQSNAGATSTPPPGRPATWNTTGEFGRYEDGRITRLRWDTRTGLVSWFKFKLETDASVYGSPIIQISKFQINFIAGTVKTINTRMPGA